MDDDFKPSEEFGNLLFSALHQGIDMVAKGQSPFIPFALALPFEDKVEMMVFLDETPEAGLTKGRGLLDEKAPELRMYALAWDGYLTVEGVRMDAVFVEAADRVDDRAVIMAQRYRPVRKGLLRKRSCERFGNPAMVEGPPSRLASAGG